MRTLLEARTAMEPAGEIRGGLQEYFSHSDIGPKTTSKTGTAKTRCHTLSDQIFLLNHPPSSIYTPSHHRIHVPKVLGAREIKVEFGI